MKLKNRKKSGIRSFFRSRNIYLYCLLVSYSLPNHFNKFFAFQCTFIDNDSQILDSVVFNTVARLSSITCEDNDILKIISNLDISKAHGFDDIISQNGQVM